MLELCHTAQHGRQRTTTPSYSAALRGNNANTPQHCAVTDVDVGTQQHWSANDNNRPKKRRYFATLGSNGPRYCRYCASQQTDQGIVGTVRRKAATDQGIVSTVRSSNRPRYSRYCAKQQQTTAVSLVYNKRQHQTATEDGKAKTPQH